MSIAMPVNTLLPVLAGVTLMRFLAMGHYALYRKIYPGFRTLVFSELLILAGIGMGLLRLVTGDGPAPVFLLNVLLLAHPVLVYHGFGAYGRVPRLAEGTRLWLLFCLANALLQAADVLIDPDMGRRVAIYSAGALALNLRIAVSLPARSRRLMPCMRLVSATYFVSALLHGLRLVDALGGYELNYPQMLQTDGPLAAFVFVRLLQSVLEMYAVFAMNSFMLEDDLKLATAQIEHLAHTDALTGVANRRGLYLSGPESLARSFAEGKPAAVLMLDLDHFKRVNDSLGHAAGDEILRGVADLCGRSLRREDVFGRYGGEEFAIVAPRTSEREAWTLAERIRVAVGQERFAPLGGGSMTVSVGVACAHSGELDELLRIADEALYEAKQNGRDRVVLTVREDELEPDAEGL